ncbi:S-layer family protein [Trichocoleus sp. DQ-U1]|uniref:S-layer family protein n=1 Tax=Trichocoleus sp. DQ-U1 TaxID=2933926 RepID=UPI0032981AF8
MNPKRWLQQTLQLGLVCSLIIIGAFFKASRVGAQIVPDETLGTESSVVVPFAPGFPVEFIFGGATRGSNLFHSFKQFDIGEIRAAYFLSPPEIKNILSRVTGGSRSEILGTLGVIGDANLFLMNPNGILFGSKASLDISGSFVATTANAIAFDTQGVFSASAPNVTPILTVNPSAFLFNQIAPQPIVIQSEIGLQVPDGRSLLLVGGDIELQAGQLKAPGGSVELGGVAQAATVELNVDGNNLHLNFPAGVQLADISLTEKAVIDTSGEGSGAIQLSGKRITLTDGSKIEANTIGSKSGGKITVTAQESLELLAGSRLLTQTIGDGAAGDVTIETGQLIVKDGAQIGSVTFSTGQGGTLSVSAAKFVELIGTSADGVDVSGLFTQTEGAGAAGNLTLKTGQLTLKDGAQVSVSTVDAAGQGGKLSVTAQESVQLIGTSAKGNPSSLFAVTQGGSGAAGDLTVKTGQLIVQDGAKVSASTFGGATGKGGTVSVTADSIQLIGTSANSLSRSGLLVGTTGSAAAGDLTIETGQLTVQNGALVSAGTLGEGQGGKLTITAKKSVQLVGISAQGQASSLLTQTSGAGTAGDLKITTGQLIVQDGAQVNVSSQGTGNAGNLEIEAGSILLDNQAALTATTKSGNGGNITLQVQELLQLRHGSSISTTAGTDKTGGNGGNMDINAKFIVAVPEENSDITANAFEGRGGNINITTSGIFGTQFRPRLTPESDITASSEFGVNGAVNINTLDVDPSRGLATLPAELVDASGLVAQTCPTGGGLAQSELILTGRGGLPDNPSETRSSSAVWTDWRISQTSRPNRISHAAKASPRSTAVAESQTHSPAIPFVEATGWGRNHQGEVVLMAAVSSSPKSLALASQCPR